MSGLSTHRMSVRDAAVAGLFYPARAAELEAMLQRLLERHAGRERLPKAIIAPHAGYAYSGDTAASVYASMRRHAERIHRVVLLGPVHRVYTPGIALSSATHFATPLGNVPLDLVWQERIQGLDFVRFHDEAHLQEHSLEVHVPFLQIALGNFSLVPLAVGGAQPGQVATVLERLWGEEETVFVISSDLSHYHDYATANRIDSATCAAISACDYQAFDSNHACGYHPLSGLLHLAKRRRMPVELVQRCNSGDTAGDHERVVGYCAFVLEDTMPDTRNRDTDKRLDEACQRQLFELAWRGVRGDATLPVELEALPVALRRPCGVFVTIKRQGSLRGCIGQTQARLPLAQAVTEMAYAAAFHDSRFPPVEAREHPLLELCLSVLSPPEPIAFSSEAQLVACLKPGQDGLVIAHGEQQATFLPLVWESLPDARQFLDALKEKAGIPVSVCPERAWRYRTESYSSAAFTAETA